MNRREFFTKTFQATAAGILVPEHLLKGRSMVSLCGVEVPVYCGPELKLVHPYFGPEFVAALEKAFDLPKGVMR